MRNPWESDLGLLHRKARAALEASLDPGETIEVIIRGPSAQAIIGTERRAFVYKKGILAGATFGSEITNWTYRGADPHGNDDGGRHPPGFRPVGHRHQLLEKRQFRSSQGAQCHPDRSPLRLGQNRLRVLLDKAHAPADLTATPSRSVVDELRHLAEMRRDGLITQEEFEEMKSHITS